MKRTSLGLIGLTLATWSCTATGYGGGAAAVTTGSATQVSGGGEGISQQCQEDFGSTVEAQRLESFLLATTSFVSTAAEVEQSLLNLCVRMGHDLGLSDADLQPQAGEPPVRSVCTRVAQKIHDDLSAVRAAGNVQVTVAATPPVCKVGLNAYADCMARCDVSVQPGQLEMQCEGGEIRGYCDGVCQGSCAAEVSGQCSGQCEGTCQGRCTGVCNGVCEGTCSAQGTDGRCNGACQGTCRGTCSAGCTGRCEGRCVVRGQASCQGECRGGCSVQYREPYCTGRVVPPRADADCKASCDAQLQARTECTPGEVHVNITGSLSGEGEQKASRLRRTLEENFGAVQVLGRKLQQLAMAGQEMVQTAQHVPDAVRTLGLRAAACATQAAAAVPRAMASVSVSVEVSVSLSASATVQ